MMMIIKPAIDFPDGSCKLKRVYALGSVSTSTLLQDGGLWLPSECPPEKAILSLPELDTVWCFVF